VGYIFKPKEDKKMKKNEMVNKAKNGGVWVLAKYLLTDSLNLSQADKVKTLFPTKIVITEDGDVDLIEVRDGIPELKSYREDQVELKDAAGMVGIVIDGNPYNKIEFEKDGNRTNEEYFGLFLEISELNKEELDRYMTPEFKYTLPKAGIVPKTAAYLIRE
jgi:hypothetical protein